MVIFVDKIVDTVESTLHNKDFFTPELKSLQDSIRQARKKFKVRSDLFNQLALEKAVEE